MREGTRVQEEIAQMEEKLSHMERDLYEAYCDVGKTILETAELEGRRINSLVDEIIEARKALAALRQEKDCPGCGAYNTLESLYCSHCGQRLDDKREEQAG